MKLSIEQVDHIAALARLELTPEEKELATEELSAILTYVGKLQELDTSSVVATSHITGELAALRPDVAAPLDEPQRTALVAQFPKSRAGLLVVPPVFSDYKE